MIEKDQKVVSTLRLIIAALKDRDIAARSSGNAVGINDDETTLLLQTMIKQRKDSIDLFKKGDRQDLVEVEEHEIKIISTFLPLQLTKEEIEQAVHEAIKLSEAISIKDMGKAMTFLKEKYSGNMDFRIASIILKEKLLK